MGRYASQTTVPVASSRAEIESLMIRYNASEFTTGWKHDAAMIGFRLKGLFIRFVLPIPPKNERRFTHRKVRNRMVQATEAQAEKAWDQECRSRWRALKLVVQAKLEAVECGISTLEQEFLAFIVLPSEMTIGDWMTKHALPAIRQGQMPLALNSRRDDVQDAEVAN